MVSEPISIEELVAYAAGELSRRHASDVESRLARSPELAVQVAALRELVATMRTDDSEAPSRRAVERAIAQFTPALATASMGTLAEWVGRFREHVAKLVFDSRAQTALAGYRGSDESHQRVYEGDWGRIDLLISERDSGSSGAGSGAGGSGWSGAGGSGRSGAGGSGGSGAGGSGGSGAGGSGRSGAGGSGRSGAGAPGWSGARAAGWRIRGQIRTSAGLRSGPVALVRGRTTEAIAEAAVDGHGRFRIDTLAGNYDLLVRTGQSVLRAPGLEIG